MRTIALLLLSAGSIALPSASALSEQRVNRQTWDACFNPTAGMSGEFIVSMCTAVYQSGGVEREDLGLWELACAEGYTRQEKHDLALDAYTRAISALRSDRDRARAYAGRAAISVRTGDLESAVVNFESAAALGGAGAQMFLEWGDACYSLAKNLECALSQWARARAIDPSLRSRHYATALMESANRDFDSAYYPSAVEKYREAEKLAHGAELHLRLSAALRRSGRAKEAAAALEDLGPGDDSPRARIERALSRLAQGEYGAGADLAEEGLRTFPDDPGLLYLRGVGKQLEYARQVNAGYSTPHEGLWELGREDIDRAAMANSPVVWELKVRDGVLPPPSKPLAPTGTASRATAPPVAEGAQGAAGPKSLMATSRPWWPVGAAALIGLAVLVWKLTSRH